MRATLLNLIGGPGTGKSTTMAGVFSWLKARGHLAEMAPEYAKDMVWEHVGTPPVFGNQIAMFGEQHRRIWRLMDKVDYVITDCPLIMSLVYMDDSLGPHFRELVKQEHRRLGGHDIFLERVKKYEPVGRVQTEDQAKAIDARLWTLLHEDGGPFVRRVPADAEAAETIGAYALYARRRRFSIPD